MFTCSISLLTGSGEHTPVITIHKEVHLVPDNVPDMMIYLEAETLDFGDVSKEDWNL